MDELLPMSKRELKRLEVMQRIKIKCLTQKEAARLLNLSVRQIKRLYRSYKAQGARGLVSLRRGQPGNHRLEAATQQKVIDLLHAHFRDFEPTLAHEKLTEKHRLQLSRESVRRIMIAEALGKPKRAKKQPAASLLRRCITCEVNHDPTF